MESIRGGAFRFTFRRRDRMRAGGDFAGAVRRGKTVGTRHLTVHARPNGLGYSRLGASAGRKFGNAVKRNKVKRLVREAFRKHQELRDKGLDVLVVARDARVLGRPEEIGEALALLAGLDGRK